MRRPDPLAPPTFRWLLAVYVALRLLLGLVPGYLPDLAYYTRWAIAAAADLPAVYETADVDYPPGYLYPLWLVAEAWGAVAPFAPADEMLERPAWMLALKLPPLGFDLAAAGLLRLAVGRAGAWGERGDPARAGRLAAWAYLVNPAVLWSSGYWGQTDAVLGALVLAAVLAAAAGRAGMAGALWCAATLTKPLGAPYGPLLAWWSLTRAGLGGAARFALGAALAALLLLAPFLLTGRGPALLDRLTRDLDAMPYTSVYAHNLWWLLGPWRDADAPWLGPLTPKALGLAAFAVASVVVLWAVGRRDAAADRRGSAAARLLHAAAAVAATFFFLSTLMHENHLFVAVPLLLAVAGRDRGLALLAAAASVACFANMFLHDLVVPRALPGWLAAPSPALDVWMRRPYTWLQLLGSFVNTLLVGAVTVGLVVRLVRDGSGVTASSPRRPSSNGG